MDKRIIKAPPVPPLMPRKRGAPFHLVGAELQVNEKNLPKIIERFRELRKKSNAVPAQLFTRDEDREYEMLYKLLTFDQRIS